MARTPFVLLAVAAAAAYADEAADDPVASGLMDKLKSFGANTMAKRVSVAHSLAPHPLSAVSHARRRPSVARPASSAALSSRPHKIW